MEVLHFSENRQNVDWSRGGNLADSCLGLIGLKAWQGTQLELNIRNLRKDAIQFGFDRILLSLLNRLPNRHILQ